MYRMGILVFAIGLLAPLAASALEGAPAPDVTISEDAIPGVPFQEGRLLTFDQVGKLKDYLPPAFWENREFFFYEGMELEIGPAFRKYGESDAYRKVTNENRGKASIGPDGSLAGYSGGLPFPSDEIDCEKDPQAGSKIVWNFIKAWNGDGGMSNFRYTYWDRGERLPIYYEGTSKVVNLKGRVEPKYRVDGKSPATSSRTRSASRYPGSRSRLRSKAAEFGC